MTEGRDWNGAWRRHHEALDDAVREVRRYAEPFVQVTHDGEKLLLIYRSAVQSVDPLFAAVHPQGCARELTRRAVCEHRQSPLPPRPTKAILRTPITGEGR